ncbi:MAG: hypothetical protein R3D71_07455 [Rickettsiales bacterium]
MTIGIKDKHFMNIFEKRLVRIEKILARIEKISIESGDSQNILKDFISHFDLPNGGLPSNNRLNPVFPVNNSEMGNETVTIPSKNSIGSVGSVNKGLSLSKNQIIADLAKEIARASRRNL